MDWATARQNLLPQVTNRGPLALAQLHARAWDAASSPATYVPLTDHLALSLVVKSPQGSASVGWEPCDACGVSRAEALSVAVENLARLSQDPHPPVWKKGAQ